MRQRIASLDQGISESRAKSEGINQSSSQAEDELLESKALFEAVVENLPLMIFLKEAKELRFVAPRVLWTYTRKTSCRM